MNTSLKYILFSILFVLSSCSGEDVFVTNGQSPRDALVLTVSADDFVTDGNSATRAADTGATTTFENNDKVGVIILDGKGNLLSNNVPYKYNNGTWAFENIDSKTQCYYDSKAVTYIVYYPYSATANDVTNVDGLKSKFAPQDDQSTEANYRASDLLVWISTPGTPLKTLTADLKHAYASVSVSPSVKYKLQDGNSTEVSFVSSKISDVSLTINSNSSYKFYRAEDGSYRYILPASSSISNISCLFTFDSKNYSSTFTSTTSVSANTRYTFTPTVNSGDYGLDKAQIGDFYCKNASDEGYLIPKDIASLTEDQQNDCVGVVYWLGDINSDNYALLDSKFPGDTHGLVVSLWDMPSPDDNNNSSMKWTYGGYEFVTNWLSSASWSGIVSRPGSFTSIQAEDKMQGYANTVALEEYNKYIEDSGSSKNQNLRVKPVKGLSAFQAAHPAPENSSGWYWPSVCELKYVCWGQGNAQSISGKYLLETQFGKVGGTFFDNNDGYWSSTEQDYRDWFAWYVDFNDGHVFYSGYKDNTPCRVRLLLAF